MRADELRACLEHVPDDAEVVILGERGGCVHVGEVEWCQRRRMAEPFGRYGAGESTAPQVKISGSRFGGGRLWAHEPPEWLLTGRWRRQAELEAKLDAIEEGAPCG